jgi:tetraacyldisaccharide 4'-kinase
MGTKSLFMPISWLYEKIADVRNALYEQGVFRIHDLGARTISIGNISMGGTGKTPLVSHVAEILADAGEKVCILTRGYGRESSGRVLVSDGERALVDARTGGDEPVELARKLIGKAIVVADADRVAAAKWALGKFPITVFILDDGFQHRRAKRDLDIVCVDATTSLDKVLLREPITNLRRANAIVITRTDLVADASLTAERLARLAPEASIFLSKSVLNEDLETAQPAFAFCAVGNPESFFELLRRAGYELKGTATFPDHHVYTQRDATNLANRARTAGATVLLTTAKDGVKLDSVDIGVLCEVVEMRIEIDNDAGFRNLVTSS